MTKKKPGLGITRLAYLTFEELDLMKGYSVNSPSSTAINSLLHFHFSLLSQPLTPPTGTFYYCVVVLCFTHWKKEIWDYPRVR